MKAGDYIAAFSTVTSLPICRCKKSSWWSTWKIAKSLFPLMLLVARGQHPSP
jgi:hypothetical protein